MRVTDKYRLMELQLGRDLAEQLRIWRNAGVSVPAMARLLVNETGEPISPSAVREWIRLLEDQAA